MKSVIKLLVCSVILLVPAIAASQASPLAPVFYLHDGDRVVMYGDSITEQRLYTVFTEAYVTTRFPGMKINWIDSGWGGDKVTGGGGGPIAIRLQRDVIAYHPTVVTIMLGMNDGGYVAFDQRLLDTYRKGYQEIIDTIEGADTGARVTVLLPSPFDDVTRPVGFPGGYNAVLLRYAAALTDLAQQKRLSTADLNSPVVGMLQKADALDSDGAQKILPDRVHPSSAGHLIMAEALLKSWGAPSVVTFVAIDASKARAMSAVNTTVTAVTVGRSISWTQLDDALPMPMDFSDPLTALVLKSSNFVDALDQETLRVTDLKEGRYTLSIDATVVGDFTASQFAGGINLAILNTPMLQQAQHVNELIKLHDDVHYAAWRTVRMPFSWDSDPAVSTAANALASALDAKENNIVEQLRRAAQPVPHTYSLSLSQ